MARAVRRTGSGDAGGAGALLGQRLRQLRRERGITASALAAGVGVTKGMISQLERGLVSPSMNTLQRLAEFLGVPVAAFFEAPKPRVAVVRSRARKKLVMPHSGIEYQLLTPGLDWRVELLYARVAPLQCGAREPYSHAGEETIFVFKGSLAVVLDGETYLLEEGDSISFEATIPHRFYNPEDREAIIVSAISPPTF